jgi:hypothetical protein
LACTTIGARIGIALVNVGLAVVSRVARGATQNKTKQDTTQSKTEKRTNKCETSRPAAKVGLDSIVAGTSILADVGRTVVDVGLTAVARIARATETEKRGRGSQLGQGKEKN